MLIHCLNIADLLITCPGSLTRDPDWLKSYTNNLCKKKNYKVIRGREGGECNSEGKGVSIMWRNPSDNITEFSTGNYLH